VAVAVGRIREGCRCIGDHDAYCSNWGQVDSDR
jgi:hypothetical protein